MRVECELDSEAIWPSKRFGPALNAQLAKWSESRLQCSHAEAAAFLVAEVRKLQEYTGYTNPDTLLIHVLCDFQRRAQYHPDHHEPGPWTAFISCAEFDRQGARVLMANVIRANAEPGWRPKRWTERSPEDGP